MAYELFHTTTAENCTFIESHGFREIILPKMPLIYEGVANNRKKPGTLGYGLYAFEDKLLAEDFKEKINGKSGIIDIKIEPLSNQLLDLVAGSESDDLKKYNAYKRMIATTPIYKKVSKLYNNQGNQSSFEGALIEMYVTYILKAKLNVDITCIKASTSTGVYYSKGSVLANGVEYLVKCNSIIV